MSMRAQWEYLVVRVLHEQGKDREYVIAGPEGTTDPQPLGGMASLFNELGADGWELTTEMIHATALVYTHGWSDVGQPVELAWVFKRPRSQAGPSAA